jgi:multidrug efflux pump subunit AcrB
MRYDMAVGKSLLRPAATVIGILGIFLLSLGLFPFMGMSFFPRTDPGQFVINVKAPSGTRIELTDKYVDRIEQDIRSVVPSQDLGMIVSNIGTAPGFSSIYSSNSGQHTAFVQVSLKEGHHQSSFDYMTKVRAKLRDDLPEISTYFQTGGLVDAVVNLGLPAPIDVQVSGNDLEQASAAARTLAAKIRGLDGVGDVLTPQDMDYPGLRVDVNREMAGRLGLTSREVVDNVITSLSSNGMIAPNYWDDPKSGNSYLLTVQYPEAQVKSLSDVQQIPLRSRNGGPVTSLGAVTETRQVNTPTEVDHYQLAWRNGCSTPSTTRRCLRTSW